MEPIETTSVKQSKLPLYISVGIIALVVLSYFFIPSVQEFLDNAWAALSSGDDKKTEAWVSQFGFWGPFFIVLAMIVQMFLIVMHTTILMVDAIVD